MGEAANNSKRNAKVLIQLLLITSIHPQNHALNVVPESLITKDTLVIILSLAKVVLDVDFISATCVLPHGILAIVQFFALLIVDVLLALIVKRMEHVNIVMPMGVVHTAGDF